jgi:hypothetical protein
MEVDVDVVNPLFLQPVEKNSQPLHRPLGHLGNPSRFPEIPQGSPEAATLRHFVRIGGPVDSRKDIRDRLVHGARDDLLPKVVGHGLRDPRERLFRHFARATAVFLDRLPLEIEDSVFQSEDAVGPGSPPVQDHGLDAVVQPERGDVKGLHAAVGLQNPGIQELREAPRFQRLARFRRVEDFQIDARSAAFDRDDLSPFGRLQPFGGQTGLDLPRKRKRLPTFTSALQAGDQKRKYDNGLRF